MANLRQEGWEEYIKAKRRQWHSRRRGHGQKARPHKPGAADGEQDTQRETRGRASEGSGPRVAESEHSPEGDRGSSQSIQC